LIGMAENPYPDPCYSMKEESKITRIIKDEK
jgi:hypothetical protein